ncbi:hypothetical protein QOT17_013801 [Balamuthia mandrillaris]
MAANKKKERGETNEDIDWDAEFSDENEFTLEDEEEMKSLMKEVGGSLADQGEGFEAFYPQRQSKSAKGELGPGLSLGKKQPQKATSTSSPTTLSGSSSTSSPLSSLSSLSTSTAPSSLSNSLSSSSSLSTSASSSARPLGPRMTLDSQHVVVAPSSSYNSFMELQRLSFSIKLIAMVHLMLSLFYFFLPDFQWTIFFSIAFVGFGLWGAHKYKPLFVLIFLVHVGINVLLLTIFIFVEMSRNKVDDAQVLFGFMCIVAELFTIHYSYTFWRKLPNQDFQEAFSQFFSTSSPTLAGMRDEEEGL